MWIAYYTIKDIAMNALRLALLIVITSASMQAMLVSVASKTAAQSTAVAALVNQLASKALTAADVQRIVKKQLEIDKQIKAIRIEKREIQNSIDLKGERMAFGAVAIGFSLTVLAGRLYEPYCIMPILIPMHAYVLFASLRQMRYASPSHIDGLRQEIAQLEKKEQKLIDAMLPMTDEVVSTKGSF